MKSIREAKEVDLTDLCQLSDEINAIHHANMPLDFVTPDGSERDASYWRGFIGKDDATVFVAEKDGSLIGAVAVFVTSSVPHSFLTSRPRGHIATIVIAENYRDKGLGRKLMAVAEGYAKGKGAQDIKLEVMAFNTRALDFYRDLGYENFSHRLSKSL